MTAPITARVTVEEFLDGDFPPGSWLIHGEVIVNDPTFEHQEIVGRLYRALSDWCEAGPGRGRAGFGGNWVMGDSVLKPDVWWTGAGREPSGPRHDGPPDLAVEVRSPGTWSYDVGPKRLIYDSAGVQELWLVDPPGRSVLTWRRPTPSAGLDVAAEVGTGGHLTTPLLPGFELAVEKLLAL